MDNGLSVVVTHDGLFYADEVTAVALIGILASYRQVGLYITRTRDPKILFERDNILVDVGGRYEPDMRRFDHHFKDAPVHPGEEWRMSSAGMIWAEIGNPIIQALFPDLGEDECATVCERFRRSFILPVDLIDNGQAVPSEQPTLSYSALISAMNPPSSADGDERHVAFIEAVNWATTAIKVKIRSLTYAELFRGNVIATLERQLGSEVLVLDQAGPWLDAILESDEMFDRYRNFQIAVFPSNNLGEWKIQSFPENRKDRFSMRCKAPENLMALNKNHDWVFVHPSGFIGGVRGSREAAIDAAKSWIRPWRKEV